MPKHASLHFVKNAGSISCLLYTSDAADERSSVDLGGRRIIKKKKKKHTYEKPIYSITHNHLAKHTTPSLN